MYDSERPMEGLLQAIRAMPVSMRLRLVERIIQEVAQEAEIAAAPGSRHAMLGLFADEPALVDEIREGAMVARELQLLRRRGA